MEHLGATIKHKHTHVTTLFSLLKVSKFTTRLSVNIECLFHHRLEVGRGEKGDLVSQSGLGQLWTILKDKLVGLISLSVTHLIFFGSGGGWVQGAQRRGWGLDVRAARWRHRGGYISEYRRRCQGLSCLPLSPLASQRSVPPARLLPPPPSAGRFHRGKGIVSYVRYPEPPLFRPLCWCK